MLIWVIGMSGGSVFVESTLSTQVPPPRYYSPTLLTLPPHIHTGPSGLVEQCRSVLWFFVMATSRSVFSTFFGTINTGLSAMDNGLGMVNRSIDNAAHNQKLRIAASQETYSKLIAQELEQELEAIDDWCNEREGRAESLAKTHARLLAAAANL